MKGSFLIIALLLFFGGYAMRVFLADGSAHRANESLVAAQNLIAFTGYVRDFKGQGQSLPSGVTSSSSIPTPSWFRPATGLFVFIHQPHEYVYSVHKSASEAARVLEALDGVARWDNESLLVGRSEGGRLHGLRVGSAVPVELPLGFPDNAVVVPITMP